MGATRFSKVDGNKAFFGMHLTEEASLLTTFNTHLRRYRFLRVPFRLKMSQDIFQMRMDDIVAQCPGVLAIHDDVFIYRKDDRDHDANIINLFNVAQKEGLVFNSKKCAIKQESPTFFGRVFSAEGYSPDPEKIQGISEMTPPQTKQELQSFSRCSFPISVQTLNHYMPSSRRRIASHGTRTPTPASRKSSPSWRKPSSDPWDTMIGPNRSPSSAMPHSRGWEPASFKTDSPLHLPANPSWTPRPAMPTSRENSWSSYMVVKNSIRICTEGHSSWIQTISPSRWSA